MGPGSFRGSYARGEGIVFEHQPCRDWQYMATGTGLTGCAVIARDELILQINHEGALDERGYLRPAGRVHVRPHGGPLSLADCRGEFRMVHDLRRSSITVRAGEMTFILRAHMGLDLIWLTIEDRRAERRPIDVFVELPYAARCRADGDAAAWWHDDGEDTVYTAVNRASGMGDGEAFPDPLQGRCFGLAVDAGHPFGGGNGWTLPPASEHRLYIAARAGVGLTPCDMLQALRGRPDPEAMRESHEAWFDEFWRRVWFECDDPRMAKFVAAYDLYRYYTCVSCGEGREFPARFQLELLSGTMEQSPWATMQIHSIQTIQAYFGIVRNGDWGAYRAFADDYRRKVPFYTAYMRSHRAAGGMLIPYETNLWGSAHYCVARSKKDAPAVDEFFIYHPVEHPYQTYTHEHGLAILIMLWDAARATGDERAFTDWGAEALRLLLTAFRDNYMGPDGRVVFDPATSGETWYDCKNPASWIALFRTALPQIEALGGRLGDGALSELAGALFKGLPPIPRGAWRLAEGGWGEARPADDEGDVILPAEDFSRAAAINCENPELYALWPYGLYGEGIPDCDLARRTYERRAWKNQRTGWALDPIFAARLGLTDEAMAWRDWQFDDIVRCPAGFSFECAPTNPEEPSLPLVPSMQGMGNSVCPLYEMICQERGEGLYLLPAWPRDIAFCIAIYTAAGGRTEIDYRPGEPVACRTQFPCAVTVAPET